MPELNSEAQQIIEQLGGPTKTAALCEISKAAVCQWRYNGIPKTQRRFLKLSRPDLFTDEPEPANTPP